MEYHVCKFLTIWSYSDLKWFGVCFDLGNPNFVLRFFIIMFTLALPSIKTSSTMFFPTCTWIITIWLSISIVVMSSSDCVSTIVVTLGSNICLVSVFGFFGFNFYHIYLLRIGVIFNNWPNLKVYVVSSICVLIPWNICSKNITLLIGLVNEFCDTMGFVDTSDSGNPAQLVFHYVFSFGIIFFDGSFACISWMALTKDYCSLCSSSSQH